MIMLIVDTILYLLIALYVETVLPGEYGVPLPWYFPCQPSYWRGNKKTSKYSAEISYNIQMSWCDEILPTKELSFVVLMWIF